MSLKISFFNRGVSKNLLRRCWPLWALYFLILVLVLPMELIGRTRTVNTYNPDAMFNREVLTAGSTMVYISFAFAAVVAMVMFSYLYNPRSCGMMNSLPIRRETMFTTALLTGVVPMLILNVLVTAFTAAVCIPGGQTELKYLLLFLAESSMANAAFYGFAVFCATLTGNIIVLPAVYFVLGITAWLAELCTSALLGYFIYGMSSGGEALSFLSPIVMIAENLSVNSVYSADNVRIPDAYSVDGLGILGIYAAVGVLFMLAGLLIYRRRHMETAGDIVAVPVLRPVFRYCMAFGGAVVFASVMFGCFFDGWLFGKAAAAVIALCVCIGAFIGWFAAQMLMKKTVRVFSSGWNRLGILCAVFVVLIALGEADVFGYERFLPESSQVESVMLMYNSTFEESGNIERILALQSQIVSDKDHNEASEDSREISIAYTLRSGKTVYRSYRVAADNADILDESSDIMLVQALINTPEAILSRELSMPYSMNDCKAASGEIYVDTLTDEQYYTTQTIELEAAQLRELFNECVYPDMRDGIVGRMFFVDCAESKLYVTTVSLSIRFEWPDGNSYWFGCSVPAVDCRTTRWVEENLGVVTEIENYDEKGLTPEAAIEYSK